MRAAQGTGSRDTHAAASLWIDTIRLTDDRGRALALVGRRQRIVSLVPAATEILFAIGAGDRIVGRTRYDVHPAAARDVPSVGDGLRPSIELVTARNPDLVVLFAGPDNSGVAAALERIGIQVLAVRHNSLPDLERNILRLGQVTGCRVAAEELLDRIRDGLEGVAAATRRQPVRSVYYDVWADPPITVGHGSYLDSLLTLAGGRNVFSDLAAPSPQVSLESIAVRDPELILWPVSAEVRADDPAPLDRPGWATIAAVGRGAVRTVDSDLMHRLGPRIVEAAAALATALHPDATAGLTALAKGAIPQNGAHGCPPP
jgi:ABC-type Fe3+-hydroxamate transport system substrate-binding protein